MQAADFLQGGRRSRAGDLTKDVYKRQVSDRVCVLPTVTLPKFRLLGLPLSAPGATPVPDKGIATVETLDAIVTLPAAEPDDVGLKPTLKLAD